MKKPLTDLEKVTELGEPDWLSNQERHALQQELEEADDTMRQLNTRSIEILRRLLFRTEENKRVHDAAMGKWDKEHLGIRDED